MRTLKRWFLCFLFFVLTGCSLGPALSAALAPTPPEATATAAPMDTASPLPPEATPTPEPATPTGEIIVFSTDTPAPVTESTPQPKVFLGEPDAGFPFSVQSNSPVYMPNFAHPDLGCNWMGVAGQAFDHYGKPLMDMVVEVGGTLNGNPVDYLGMTGTTKAYGPFSYEITLANKVLNSSGTLWIHLLNLGGITLTGQVSFDTHADCTQNLIVINFKEMGPYRLFFPFVGASGQ